MHPPAFSSISPLHQVACTPTGDETTNASTTTEAPFIPAQGRVAVIGAGAAGLQSARQLTMKGYDVHIFDKNNHVGGIWETKSSTSTSPIYNSLYTNVTRYEMVYEDDEHPPSVKSFLSHAQVNAYLQGYANKHDLRRMIKFRHVVTDVYKDEDTSTWTITTTSNNNGVKQIENDRTEMTDGDMTTEAEANEERTWVGYDAVFVCTGHFSKPRLWTDDKEVPGYENLAKNNVLVEHSMYYRAPYAERYGGKRVVVIGAGPSGVDVALELSSIAQTLYMSHSLPRGVFSASGAERPENICEIGRICEIWDDGSLEMDDGEVIDRVDVIVTCTGYRRDYGFVRSEHIRFSEDARNVFGLLKHCVCIKDPTLIFIGIPYKITPLPTFELQVAFGVAVLQGTAITRKVFEELVKEEEEGVKKWKDWKNFHVLAEKHWDYIKELARVTGYKKIAPALVEISDFCTVMRSKDPVNYRKMEVCMHGFGSGMWSATKVKCQRDVRYGQEVDA